MGDADRTYTEVEHLALMADAVTRETAELSQAKVDVESQLSTATARVDVLEAEKAKLEADLEAAKKEFADFKAGIEELAAIDERKAERKEAVKAANGALPDAYFTDDRVQAWAEMSDETFAVVVDGVKATADVKAVKETAAFGGGVSPTASVSGVKNFLAARRGGAN